MATVTGSKKQNIEIEDVTGLQSDLDSKLESETVTSISVVGNELKYIDEAGTTTTIDLTTYLDDTNLARITRGTYDSNTQSLVFTRDDDSTFSIDASMFFDDTNLVTSVAGKTGAVSLSKSDVGLGNVDNTADSVKTVAKADKLTTARTIALSGDITGSTTFDGSGNVSITATIADDSHNHVISNIDGLQTALDGKLASGANAVSASKLATARTLALSGDVSGSVSFDGSANATITAAVMNDSHTHDGRYYTEAESDARFVNVAGDTMTGQLSVNAPLKARLASLTGSGNDFNNFAGVGFYNLYSTRSSTNAPPLDFGTMFTMGSDKGGATFAMQLAHERLNNGLFIRGMTDTGSAWNSWQRIFQDNYHPNADKWTTARTLSLSGDASGSVSWDGSANANLSVTVADDSHNHTIANIDGLQAALNGKTTESYVNTQIANLVATAPATMDTLNELAAALGDDPNFATTVSSQIGAKLNSSAYTASDVLTKVKTVDGSGSGLDADLLDGLHASSFMRSVSANGYYGLVDPAGSASNWIRTTSNGLLPYASGGASSLGTSSWPFTNIYGNNIYDNGVPLESKYLGISAKAADADKLDGLDSGSFLRSDTADTFTTLTGTSVTASLIGNASTASRWATGRTIKIGNTSKTVDGSANVTWSISEIGAAPSGYGLGTYGRSLPSSILGNTALRRESGFWQGSNITGLPTYGHTWKYLWTQAHSNPAGYWGYIGVDFDCTAAFFGGQSGGVDKTAIRLFADNYHPNADKWTAARTLSLTGDVSGSVSFDGSANASITAVVADDSHNHVISNVDGLQTALDGKLATGANAVSASKLATARTIALTGDVTGSASFDGSANATITAVVANNSQLGVNQTWQDVIRSRSVNVTYTNNTGKPIVVSVGVPPGDNNFLSIAVNGLTAAAEDASAGSTTTISAIVPTGSTYVVRRTSSSPNYWCELR